MPRKLGRAEQRQAIREAGFKPSPGFDIEVRTPEPSTITQTSALRARQRRAATAPPDRPSACRSCGVAVKPGKEVVPASEFHGWRVCRDCWEFSGEVDGNALAWRHLLGDETVTVAEATWLNTPPYFFGSGDVDGEAVSAAHPGHPERWSHLHGFEVPLAEKRLRSVRTKSKPHRTTYGACRWCGIRAATGWKRRDSFVVCGTCAPRWDSAGCPTTFDNARDHMFGALMGLPGSGLMHINYGLRAHAEVHRDCAGHEQPWAYLDAERAKIRDAFVRSHPKYATEAELRELRADAQEARIRRLIAERRKGPKLSDLP